MCQNTVEVTLSAIKNAEGINWIFNVASIFSEGKKLGRGGNGVIAENQVF